jgi:hypothetical protein
METTDAEFAALHAAFLAGGGLLIALPSLQTVTSLQLFVVAYNVFFPSYAYLTERREWLDVWGFVFPLSLCLIIPDWFLTTVIGTLTFPTAAASPGPVPIAMAGLWAFALVTIVYTGIAAPRYGIRGEGRYAVVALVSLLTFVGAEVLFTKIPIWRATGVATLSDMALYIVGPEVLLGVATFWTYWRYRLRSILFRTLITPLVMFLYLGGVGTSYLIFEHWLAA